MREEEQDTRESDAIDPSARVDPVDTGATADPAATATSEPVWEVPAGAAGQSPLEADIRGADAAPDPPIVEIVGAFVGAFVAAKLLGRLGGGGD